jgi:hypothetical protein
MDLAILKNSSLIKNTIMLLKKILILFLLPFIAPYTTYSQNTDSLKTVYLQKLKEPITSIYPKQFYLYNNSKDTIHLSPMPCYCDKIKVLRSIQIDEKGANEIVLYRKCSGIIGEHGGTFDISGKYKLGRFEIWNLDTKKLLFEGRNLKKVHYKTFKDYGGGRKKEVGYKYLFKINKNRILIKYLNKKTIEENNLSLDNEEGVYRFSTQGYQKE